LLKKKKKSGDGDGAVVHGGNGRDGCNVGTSALRKIWRLDQGIAITRHFQDRQAPVEVVHHLKIQLVRRSTTRATSTLAARGRVENNGASTACGAVALSACLAYVEGGE
jgi:hypothetical protein